MTDLTNSRIPLNPPDPAELISYIPYHLKFKPADSLVVLTAHRKLRELGISFLARMDIDTLFDPAAAARARTGFVANLVHQSAREGFMVLYSDELFTALTSETLQNPGVEDRTALITLELARWYDIEYFRPTRTYVVGETRWRCLACPRPGHCPTGGHPTSVFSHTSVAAEMVARGKHFAPSRADLVVLPPAPPPSVVSGRVEEELRALHRYGTRTRPLEWKRHMTGKWADVIDHMGQARGESELGASELCILALSLHDVSLRDNVIYAICTGNDLPGPLAGSDMHFAAMFHTTSEPDTTRMCSALGTLEAAAASCPQRYRAPILTVWAWCNWWVGNGAEANILVDLALEHDDKYSLASTMRKVLNGSLLPPWMVNARRDER